MKKWIVSIGLILCVTVIANAQKTKQAIKVLTNGKGDSMLLRWAPSTPFLWQMGNKYGYIIERFTVKEDGKAIPPTARKMKLLTTVPLKPATRTYFDSLEKIDDRSAIVGEAIYGDEFKLEATAAGGAGILQKSQEMDSRFGFALLMCDLSPLSAKAAGLSFVDHDIKPSDRYIYRVKLAKPIPNVNYEAGVALTDGNESFKLNNINDLTSEFTHQSVLLKWSVFLHSGVYSAYIVEKSEDGQNFQTITSDPLINASQNSNDEYAYYVDSLADNKHNFYYRIKGISPFGETGPPSNIITGKGKDEMTTLTIIDSAIVLDNDKVKINWRLDNANNQPVKGFYVMKAAKDEGPYQDLNRNMLPPTAFSFTDSFPGRSNYYRVKTILANDDISFSYSHLALLVDSMPPAIPASISGAIDSVGVVRIKWDTNKEEDMLGYRVFRSNSLREEFVEVTRNLLAKPGFKDTVNINTLTSKVYYKVIAVDKSFNTSDYSPAFELRRPDTIAPAPPVFAQVRRADTTIQVNWVPGHAEDLAKHVLYRIQKATSQKEKLVEWNAAQTQSTFTDRKGLVNGEAYVYLLEAYDSTGNVAASRSGDIYFETGIRKPILDINAKAEREKRLISIDWKYGEKNIRKIVVYRNKQGEAPTIYQTLNENPGNFEDKDLYVNNTYIYRIQAIFNGGAKSPISKELVVKY